MSLALIAGACGNKKDEDTVGGGDTTPGTETPSGTDGAVTPGTDASATTEAPLEPVVGGKLTVAGEAEASNPWTPKDVQCDSFCQMRARTIFEPLMAVDNDTLEPMPYLAESVTPNEDYTVWSVKLREGITFHDGTPLDAAAAVKNLQNTGKGFLLSYSLNDVAKENGELKVVQTGDLTFDIYTGKDGDPNQPLPWPAFPFTLSGQWTFMASPDWLDKLAAGSAQPDQPVGTGPFVFDSFSPGNNMVVKKNPNYWQQDANGNPLPYLDEIEFKVIADSQVRGQALRDGNVDLIATSDGSVISEFVDDDAFNTLQQKEYGETSYTLLNLSKPGPLQSRDVRCALAQAIDKQDLVEVATNGFNEPANGPFSPGQEGYLEDNGALPYDVEAAKAAIDAYEAANGPITLNYEIPPSASNQIISEFTKDAWSKIGVDTNILPVEQSKHINNALLGDPNVDAYGWRNHAGLVLDNQYGWWHSSTAQDPGQLALNFARLKDPVIDENLEKARQEADPDKRREYAEAINREFAEQCWILAAWYTSWGIISDPSVQGLGTSPIPDGGTTRDGAGFPGQVWLTSVFVDR